MTALHFNLRGWCAAAPGLSEKADWKAWAESGAPVSEEAPLPSPAKLPLMARRRLSKGARLALECSIAAITDAGSGIGPGFTVFASRHGELPRAEQLLSALARGESLSPAAFTMSVHNAAAGSYAIFSKCRAAHASVAAGAETFSMALAESFSVLESGQGLVLLTVFENELPPLLGDSLSIPTGRWPWAAAFVLEPGDDFRAELARTPYEEPRIEEALQFVRGLVLGRREFETRAGAWRARWSRR